MKKQSISDRDLYKKFIATQALQQDGIKLVGKWQFEITRANGQVEKHYVENTLASTGLDHLAACGVVNGNSAFLYLAIGTQTAESSLGSVQGGMGEVDRKIASLQASSNEVMILVATWAGDADSLTSLDLRTASAVNHATSGSGVHLNYVNSVATILADSDFLKVQMEVQVGSHNI